MLSTFWELLSQVPLMISSSNPADVYLNFTVADTVLSVTFGELDATVRDTIRQTVAQGVAIGASLLLMFLSWLLVVKKLTPMFLLHQISLLFLVIRSALYLAYLLGPFNSLSFQYTGLFYNYWDSFHVTIATNTFYVLLIATIECILVVQIYVIFKSSKTRYYGIGLAGLSALLAVVVVVLYIISVTHNLQNVKSSITDGYTSYASWENNLPFIMFSVSINYNCVLLLGKLIVAVRTRRRLGLKQFDSMHILLIMTTQTCIVPSIMVIYNYTRASQSSVYLNLSVIIIVCNLPFSSLWATSSNNTSTPNSYQNIVFSRTTTNESNERTISSPYRMQKVGSPISDYEKGTLSESVCEAAGAQSDTDSIERILNEVEQDHLM